MADEQDSGSCERYAREGSSPFFRMVKALADARAQTVDKAPLLRGFAIVRTAFLI